MHRSDASGRERVSPLVSLVVPVLNEEDCIASFLQAVLAETDSAGLDVEVLFIDDGSTDSTVEAIEQAIESDRRVRMVSLSRNFGKEAALTAGLDYAAGDVVVPMDVDLQDPPSLIARFVEKWREGFDVVYARRVSRSEDGAAKRLTAGAFYDIFNRMSATKLPDNVGDFRLMDRRVVEALALFPERNRFMKGLFSAAGFSAAAVEYERPSRTAGTTKWNYWKLWNFALDGILGFSTVPLRIWTYIGGGVALLAMAYAVFIAARTAFFGADVPGYASLMVAILLMGGMQLISLGIIGEYVGRMFLETKRRPIYLVKARSNIGAGPQTADAQARPQQTRDF